MAQMDKLPHIPKEYLLTTNNYRTISLLGADGTEAERLTSSQKLWHCLPGDTITYDAYGDRWIPTARAKYPPLVGRLELASTTKYGMTSRGNPMYLFLPFRKEFPPFVVGCSERDTRKNRIGVIDFESWPDNSAMPRGNLRRLLGVCGNMEVERAAILATYTPYKLKHDPYDMTDLTEELYDCLEEKDRVDVPCLTFSIDPEGCKDVDDVISIEPLSDTSMNLWITISDVASLVPAGSDEDVRAQTLCQTTYTKGVATIPMLPVEFSEGLCSLVAGQERVGISLVLRIREGKVLSHKFVLSRVTNMYQFTYESFIPFAESIGIPLQRVESAVRALGAKTMDTHEWVEVCMLEYNKRAAELLVAHGGGILRKHKKGDEFLHESYEEILSGLGRLADKAATYCKPTDAEDIAHESLGVPMYCHASSPIRRYADLVNQRALHAILRKKEDIQVGWKQIWHMNQRSRDLKHYERDLAFLDIVEKTPSGTIDAYCIDVKKTEGLVDTWSHTLWVPAWERFVSWKTGTALKKGEKRAFNFYMNPSNRLWKDRIVLRLVDA